MEESINLKDPHLWLEMALQKFDHARKIFEIGLYDDAVSRAYYAMYYAAKAALLTRGIDLRRHSSTVAKFNELFVYPGLVEAKYLRYLGRAETARERSDYAPFSRIDQNGAVEVLETADAFIAKMKELVEKNADSSNERIGA